MLGLTITVDQSLTHVFMMPLWDLWTSCFVERHKQVTCDQAGRGFSFTALRHEAAPASLSATTPDRRSAAKLLTRDEARRLAVNFAKLPELPRRNKL